MMNFIIAVEKERAIEIIKYFIENSSFIMFAD